MTEIELKFEELHNLYVEWKGKENYRVPGHVITQMFNLHNYLHPQTPEYSKSCNACRAKVWDRLKRYYEENRSKYGK